MDYSNSYSDNPTTPHGKVSKAKKGKPVHVCSECQKSSYTPKKFTDKLVDATNRLTMNPSTNVKFAIDASSERTCWRGTSDVKDAQGMEQSRYIYDIMV
ncbi:uncharacterized protein FTOL_11739 [Fusarium torulosum]|uniref:Uncharacterized protein n=1 Tax=Fusarium torulosum TaxID=33205 RepID=A0AAE8MJA9_9HYPO|nr:uncharacterized protein FTOL_11739 [Fusarium torulosum]